MADFAASSPPRSKGSSTAKGRARAASSADVPRPARAAVEPESATVQEAGDALQLPPIDPRQGTLLGFELPPEALALIGSEPGTVEAEAGAPVPVPVPVQRDLLAPVQVARVARGKSAPAEALVVEAEAAKAPAVETAVAPKQAAPTSEQAASTPKQAAAKPVAPAPKQVAPEPQLLSPGAALASVRQQAPRRAADAARPSAPPASVEADRLANAAPAFAASFTPDAPAASAAQSTQTAPVAAVPPITEAANTAARPSEPALPAELAATVASLREALSQERMAAQERWRRTRHWLGLSLGGFVLLFAVSVAQTVALIGFTHRAQAEQQKTQSALAQQQTALAGLASSTSALAALVPSPAQAASTPEASVPHEHHRVKPVHARRLKDRGEKADKPEKTEKAKPAAR